MRDRAHATISYSYQLVLALLCSALLFFLAALKTYHEEHPRQFVVLLMEMVDKDSQDNPNNHRREEGKGPNQMKR